VDEAKGKVKSVDPDKNTITVTDQDGKDHTFPLTDKTEILDTKGKVDEAAGKATGNRRTQAEGTADKVVVKAEPQEKGPAIAKFPDTDISGIYEVQLTANDNSQENMAFAYNVDAAEGNLKQISREQLGTELKDVVYEYHHAVDLYLDAKEMQGSNLSETVLFVLIALLVGEQLLAYSISYHPARLQGAR
jgi:hypothetical protein